MKKTLRIAALLASLFAANAQATILFYANNEIGGTIQFSDLACHDLKGLPRLAKMKGLASMIVDSRGVPVLLGCYAVHAPNIAVTWADGTMRLYPAANVTWTDEGREEIAQAQAQSGGK
jgi:hypothetical protein